MSRYTAVNTKEVCAKEVIQAGKRVLHVMAIAGHTPEGIPARSELENRNWCNPKKTLELESLGTFSRS